MIVPVIPARKEEDDEGNVRFGSLSDKMPSRGDVRLTSESGREERIGSRARPCFARERR